MVEFYLEMVVGQFGMDSIKNKPIFQSSN